MSLIRPTTAPRAAFLSALALAALATLAACADRDLTAPAAPRSGVAAPAESPSLAVAAATVAPALPRTYLNTDWVEPTGRRLRVAAGGDLQAAIDSAKGGDVVLLQAGARYTGNFRLRAKPAGDAWITIMTDTPLPAPGTRMTPSRATQLAKLVTNTNEPALFTRDDAHHYRVVGVEITASGRLSRLSSTLVALGYGDDRQTTTAHIPHHITLDRVYVHGLADLDFKRCVALNSASTAVVDSYLSECHSDTQDSQAIQGHNGPGPYKIVNNYLEGAGENVMFGGDKIHVANQLPSDVEIRRNHIVKPLAWKGAWIIKNLFELKAAQRVLVEGNVLENSWRAAQTGYAFLFKSSGSSSNTWVATRDVTVRYNVVRNVAFAVNVNDNDSYNQPAGRIRFEHNLFDGVGASNGTTVDRGVMFQGKVHDVAVVHNTLVPNTSTGTVWLLEGGTGEVGANLTAADNVVVKGAVGMSTSGWGEGTEGLNHYYSSWTWKNNVQVGFTASRYPSTNFAPRTTADVRFVDYDGGDYRLASTSPYAGKASDGTDPGADIDLVNSKTGGVTAR